MSTDIQNKYDINPGGPHPAPVKALSLLQPWASLLMAGHKQVETRSWRTAYRGRIWIHASAGRGGQALARRPEIAGLLPEFSKLPFGALIGTAVLRDIVPAAELLQDPEFERRSFEFGCFGSYAGRYAWLFDAPEQAETPYYIKGRMGIWTVTW